MTNQLHESGMLTGERKERYFRVARVDMPLIIVLAAMPLLLDKWVSFGWLAGISLLGVVLLQVYRFSRRETLWQIKRDEIEAGKAELKRMRKEIGVSVK